MDQVRVAVWASDPISRAGLVFHLAARREVLLVPGSRRHEAAVRVLATGRVTPDVLSALRTAAAESPSAIVLMADHVEVEDLARLEACRVSVVLPREAIAGDRLVAGITAAASGQETSLFDQVENLRRSSDESSATTLSEREIEVLRLLADGWDTAKIATKLCYSERTVKNVIHAMTNRLKLRNRPHAVAYALRVGVI